MPFQTFQPHPLIRGGHLQTLVGHFVAKSVSPKSFDRIAVDLIDGDKLQLHVDHPQSMDRETKPVVLLMHGLGGCSESRYILRIAHRLNELGYIAVRFNHRGCGHGGLSLATQIYHAGRTEDIRSSLAVLHQTWPARNILLVSFSLSANMTLLLLGKEPEIATQMPRLAGALTICPPVDLAECAEALARRDNKHIDYFYTKLLLQTAHQRSRIHSHIKASAFPRRMSLKKFDEIYTAPQAGFSSIRDYYETCSSQHVLDKITIPTTIIAAADDPIIPPAALTSAKISKQVNIHLQPGGGHMGFITGKKTSLGDFRWMDEAVVRWVVHQS